MNPSRSKSQTGDVSLRGEKIGIQDTTIAGDCAFSGQVIIINGQTWLPKGRA